MKITILNDDNPENPRQNDNMGTMSCRKHRRYTFGDEQFDGSIEDFVAKLPKNSVVIPLYMYDHGNVTVATTPFSCPFDSARLGVIWVSPKDVRANCGSKADAMERARNVLEAEVREYNHYVSGEVYGLKIESPGEDPETTYGYYGADVFKNGMAGNCSDEELPHLAKAAAAAGLSCNEADMANDLAERLARRTQKALSQAKRKPAGRV